MIKLLFLDFRDYEIVRHWRRRLRPPRKHRGPLLISDHPGEGNFVSMYGSVIYRSDTKQWQMWYTIAPPHLQGGHALACAVSDDGIRWQRAERQGMVIDGRPTHVVFDKESHGACVYYDPQDPRPHWRYKMLCGAAPSSRITAYRSPDGVQWHRTAVNPVIGSNPDSPISFHRSEDGLFVAYHRKSFGDRRVGRSESWDFQHFTPAQVVMEPDAQDPPQTQFYGMGVTPYGNYELGTLWIYRTYEEDMEFSKPLGHQHPELAYCRTGYAWHRAAQGEPWIRRGPRNAWDWGMVQTASHAVLLEDEIRYYYAGIRVRHPLGRSDPNTPNRCGIGMARMKPDRFVGLSAGARQAELLTRPFWTGHSAFYVNAAVAKNGSIRAEITDTAGKPIAGYGMAQCQSVSGDAIAHRLTWKGKPLPDVANQQIRMRITARHTELFSIFSGADEEIRTYWRFRGPHYLAMEREKALS